MRLFWSLAMLALPATGFAQQQPSLTEVRSVLAPLIETYGVSGMEGPVRETVIVFAAPFSVTLASEEMLTKFASLSRIPIVAADCEKLVMYAAEELIVIVTDSVFSNF